MGRRKPQVPFRPSAGRRERCYNVYFKELIMEKFREWYVDNQDAITWFLVGFLVYGGIDQLAKGNYGSALLDFGLAYANYFMNRVRIQ
jgi:hypothetical protein